MLIGLLQLSEYSDICLLVVKAGGGGGGVCVWGKGGGALESGGPMFC